MAEVELQARPRTVFGKQVKRLRAAGSIPANIFGPGQPSLAIEIDARELRSGLAQFGTATLVRLRVAGEVTPRPVLLRGVARRPTTHETLHLDFYQMAQGARARLRLPLHFSGESPAARATEGATVRHLDTIEVEGVPGEVPEAIAVDLSRIATVEDGIFVRDLPVPAGVTVLTPPDTLVAKVVPSRLHGAEVAEQAAGGKETLPAAKGA